MVAELDLFTGQPAAHSALQQWAEDARQAAAVAVSLAPTPFVPASLRHTRGDVDEQRRVTTGNITAAILTGQELGLTPMASLRSINIIQGTPAMTALAMRGLVQSRGHQLRKVESSADRCVYEGRRAGSDGPWERSVWTFDRARKMGLTGKPNWQNQPENMLIARASSEVCRLVAADVLLGVPYSAEELEDMRAEEEAAKPQRVQRARVQRLPQPRPEPEEPPLDEVPSQQEQLPEPGVDDEPEPITKAQLTALNAALTQDLGITDRAEKLAYLSAKLGRDLASSKDVTKAEASRLLDEIAAQPAPGVPEPEFDEPPPGVGEPYNPAGDQ
jgi:hypothetical protein